MIKKYIEAPEKSEYSRQEYFSGISALAKSGFDFLPRKSNATQLEISLGAPLDRDVNFPCPVSQEFLGCDELCEIFRLTFYPLPKTPFFALLFVPHTIKTPSPLVIAAHGLLGTAELMYGMHGKNGYSNIISRLLKKNVCVLAPSFLLWNCGQSPAKPCYATKYDRVEIDKALKSRDSSITALEIFFLLRALDALSGLRFLNLDSVAACGMSYGAFLTLRAMAVSPKIRAGYFMSCANGSIDERFPEWLFREPYRTLRDSELLSLCAPRPVFVEVGRNDDIFPVDGAIREANAAENYYKEKNCGNNFRFSVWEGGHLVNPENDGIEFILNSINLLSYI